MEIRHSHFATLLLSFLAVLLIRCKGDDAFVPEPTGRSKVFKVINTDLSSITGTATFIENEDESTTIKLDLENMDSGREHPVFIRRNTAAEGGGIALDLGTIDANKGTSSVTVRSYLYGDPINYEELIDLNGYLGIEQGVENPGLLLGYTDIGPNELTGESITYGIVPTGNSEVAGTAKFLKRASGTTLIEIGINQQEPGTSYPVSILNENGEVLIELNPLKSEKGNTSLTQIPLIKDSVPIGYQDLLDLNGRIVIHPSASNLDVIIAEGGIGSNVEAKIF